MDSQLYVDACDHPSPMVKQPEGQTVIDISSSEADSCPFQKDRAQWLRAAILGATDGLVSTASLVIGLGSVKKTVHALLVAGIASLVAGACSMCIGEYVSVKAQYEIEKKELKKSGNTSDVDGLPSAHRAAAASFMSFVAGASLPLLAGGFIKSTNWRLMAVSTASSVGFACFGSASAFLGGSNLMKATIRTLVGGWLSMAFTFGVVQLFALAFHDPVFTTS